MTFRVDFYHLTDDLTTTPLGSARLVGDTVEFDAAVASLAVDVGEPETYARLTPADGQRYLRALPHHYANAYLWCELVDEGPTAAVRQAAADARQRC